VIYDFSTEEKIITIDKIGHRREIYGWFQCDVGWLIMWAAPQSG
jgi:hypothetical protein